MLEKKITKDNFSDEKIDVFCKKCQSDTKHLIVSEVKLEGRDNIGGSFIYGWDDYFQIVQCQGCEELSFRKLHMNSEDEECYETEDGWD